MILKLHLYEKGIKINVIEITAKKANIKIGREEDSDIRIINNRISRKHCEIVIDKDTVAVKDMDSTQGTYLNQKLVGKKGENQKRYLKVNDGDGISLTSEFEFYVERILENAGTKTCMMCGKPFQTSNSMQEFCFDCNLEMEKELGIKREEPLCAVQVAVSKEDSAIISIKQETLKASSYQVIVRKKQEPLENIVDFYHKTFKKNKYGGCRAMLMKMLLCIHQFHHKKENSANQVYLQLNPNQFLVKTDEKNQAQVFMGECKTSAKKTSLDAETWNVWVATAIAYYMITGHYPKKVMSEEKAAPIWAYDYQVPAEFAKIIDLALKDHGTTFYFTSAYALIQALNNIKIS